MKGFTSKTTQERGWRDFLPEKLLAPKFLGAARAIACGFSTQQLNCVNIIQIAIRSKAKTAFKGLYK